MPDGLDDISRARLSFRADHGSTFVDAPQRLTEISGATDERNLEWSFIDVRKRICGREDFGLIDEVDLKFLEDPRLSRVPDAHLRHDGDRYRSLDLLDELRVTHTSYSAMRTDIARDALEGHHRACTSLFGNLGLLCRDDIHDHPTLEHACEIFAEDVAVLHRS